MSTLIIKEGKEMEKTGIMGNDPREILKTGGTLPDSGIIFTLEKEPGKYNEEAVGKVLFYEKGVSEVFIQEEKFGGHITIFAPGDMIMFSIQNLENPDSEREPYNRQSGYIPISFKNLEKVLLKNNVRALVEKKMGFPPRNFSLSNWDASFSRIFEKRDVDGLRSTMIAAMKKMLQINENDAEIVTNKIIRKFV